MPPPATTISGGQRGGAAGRTCCPWADGTNGVTSPRTRPRGSRGHQGPQVSGVAATKGTLLGEDRGQALPTHLFAGPWTPQPTCMGSLGCPRVPHTAPCPPPASHQLQLLGVPWGHEEQPNPLGKVGEDQVPPHGVSQHLGLSPSPKGCSWASKALLGQGMQGTTSASSHEGTMDGSSLRPRLWGSTSPRQSPPSHAVPLAGVKPPPATGLAKLPVLRAGRGTGATQCHARTGAAAPGCVPPPPSLLGVAGTA